MLVLFVLAGFPPIFSQNRKHLKRDKGKGVEREKTREAEEERFLESESSQRKVNPPEMTLPGESVPSLSPDKIFIDQI